MALSAQPLRRVRFGEFELDLQTAELRNNGHKFVMQEQTFQVLVVLLEQPGQLVTREELTKRLWPSGSLVDFDLGLNKVVNRLRQTLGDSADHPRFIETLPRKGYRFVAPVEVRAPELPAASAETKPSEARNSLDWRLWAAPTALFLTFVAAIFFFARSNGERRTISVEVVPFTGMNQREGDPTFSPDGNQVAFTLFEPADRAGIYIMVIGGEKPLRLTEDSKDCCPVWSPDGRAVAFERLEQAGYSIYTLPALGGTPKALYSDRYDFSRHVGVRPAFSWSPDGTQLAVSAVSPDLGQPAITLISLQGGARRPITIPPSAYSDWCPAFSPDGKSIAFLRSSGTGMNEDLYTVPVTGGHGKRLTFDNLHIGCGLAWTPDSGDIVFSSGRAGAWTLWRSPASGGNPQRVEGVGTFAGEPAIALKGRRLAYTSSSLRMSLERVSLIDPKHLAGPPQSLLSAKGSLYQPTFSADGRKLAFESSQSGYNEIWTAASDGSSPTQLTFLTGWSGTPHWSYDGRLVAFDYRPAEKSEIYIADVSGGPPRMFLTNPGANNIVPIWSRDGHWIYFASSRGQDSVQVWKAHYPEGGTIQLTQQGGIFPLEGADGYLYYSKSFRSDEIWKIPVAGGSESLVLKEPDLNCFCNWALASTGIYFIAGKRSLNFYDFSRRTITELLRFEKDVTDPALSADGRSLVFSQTDEADQSIMLVNHFR